MATILELPQVPVADATDPRLLSDAHGLYGALNELLRVVQFRDRDLACCYDVSVTQCYALKAVVDGGPMTVNDLAARLYLDKSTASRVAGGLEDKGYVGRERDASDGRIVRLRATRQGVELCGRIEAELARAYARMLEDFDPEVRSAMIRLLGRLAGSFAARVDASGGSCCVVR
ncbi:MAG TPA: MarR family transcriptional regulator [Longimicrobiales bacterium]|nr:MarR family transcriptional regulator [Longimicrobiales bacterium]